jgi:hypothetical protein
MNLMLNRKEGYTERETALTECNIERVINTTMTLLIAARFLTEEKNELREINIEDWHLLKTHVVHLWNEARTDVFIKRSKETQ